MSNERGHYGKNVLLAGETPRAATVYVERAGMSTGTLILGAIAVGGAILFARHQSQQIKHLYKAEGQPYQSFTGSLRESAKELPTRAREAYRGFTTGIRPRKAAKTTDSAPALPSPEQLAPAHSVRTRSGGR